MQKKKIKKNSKPSYNQIGKGHFFVLSSLIKKKNIAKGNDTDTNFFYQNDVVDQRLTKNHTLIIYFANLVLILLKCTKKKKNSKSSYNQKTKGNDKETTLFLPSNNKGQ